MPELRDKVIQYHSDSATLEGLSALIVSNSDTDKNLQPGEIAVTTNPGNEGLHTLDSAGTGLVTYRPLSAVTGDAVKLNTYETATGNTSAELTPTGEDTVSQAFGKLTKAILDNEYTVALALTTMNNSVGFTDQGRMPDMSNTKYLVGLNSVTACLRALDTAIPATAENLTLGAYETATGTTEAQLTPTSADTIPVAFGKLTKAILDNEFVTALGLTTLNSNVGFGTNGNMPDLSNTNHLSGLTSVVACLRALDKAIGASTRMVTQSEYDALSTKDPNTLYVITEDTANRSVYGTDTVQKAFETAGANLTPDTGVSEDTGVTEDTGMTEDDIEEPATGGTEDVVTGGTEETVDEPVTGETEPSVSE